MGRKTDDFDATSQAMQVPYAEEAPSPGPSKSSPLPPGPKPWLEVISGPQAEELLLVTKPMVMLGRVENVADVVIEDDGASRHHAAICHLDGVFTLYDMGSTNGTVVDGERVTSRVLEDGTEIRIGDTVMCFRRGG